jgi:hypothetical protein
MTGRRGETPRALSKHLSKCGRCRRRYQRLSELEEKLQSTPVADDDAGLAAFLQKIPALPTQGAPTPRPRRRQPLLAVAASILFFVGVGSMLFFLVEDPPVPGPLPGPRTARADDQLVSRFVQRDLLLADTTIPTKQWHLLAAMADDLREEAVRLTETNAPDNLPMVASLYERVLQRGLLGRAATLPDADRKALLQALAQQLRSQDVAMQQRLRAKPADWVTLLQPIQKATRQTADSLTVHHGIPQSPPHAPEAIPGGSDYRGLLLSALVMNGLRLAEESDPLKRADCCSDVADHLLQAIVTASVKGDQHNVSTLGRHLGEFVERGVSANLARVPNDDPRVAELKNVMQRTNQIMLALDQTLEQASAKGPPGQLDPAALARLKELEKTLKDVEKSLKKIHHSFKDGDKAKAKEKDHKGKDEKGKGKGKEFGEATPCQPRAVCQWLVARRSDETMKRDEEIGCLG